MGKLFLLLFYWRIRPGFLNLFFVLDGGASSFACSETYGGPSAFSEVETKSLSEYITSIQKDLVAYIAFHSYSQLLLLPYGYSKEHLENFNELVRKNICWNTST